jgi:uncharacterized protein with PIN domain
LRFLADAMLGKLARWLRIIGHDTVYLPSLNDSELIALAQTEGRTILTRDVGLYQRATKASICCVLIKSLSIHGELLELSVLLKGTSDESRCPICNSPLQKLERSGIDDPSIPDISPIWSCRQCGKTYWHGTHWRRIAETLKVLDYG